jgi:hypothetical protein
MNATTGVRYAYKRGDEVVVVLGGVRAHSIERGAFVEAACLPSWTIGVVLDCRRNDGARAYLLRIEHDGCACVCTVHEDAIEGLA